jgi:hypothetical protein
LSGRRDSSQSRLEFSHALQASGAVFVSISGLIYFSREAAPLLSRRFSFSICSSSVTPSFDFCAVRLWFLSVFVFNRFLKERAGRPCRIVAASLGSWDNPFFRPMTRRPSLLSLPRLSRRRCLGFKVSPPASALSGSLLRLDDCAAGSMFCSALIRGPFLGSINCHRFFTGSSRFGSDF